MKKILSAMLASLFMFAVLLAVPAYTDFVDNPGITDTQGAHVPDVMGSWE